VSKKNLETKLHVFMKISIKFLLKIGVWAAILVFLTFTSCKKDENSTQNPNDAYFVSMDEARKIAINFSRIQHNIPPSTKGKAKIQSTPTHYFAKPKEIENETALNAAN
jgi:hypothetical protein